MASDQDKFVEFLTSVDPEERGRLADKLVPQLYEDLHNLAQVYFRHERADHTLQPTALIHEAYLRLVDQSKVSQQARSHFFATCARVMRNVLVDYARGKKRLRRGGAQATIALESDMAPVAVDEGDVVALHDAIEKLGTLDARQSKVVELRFFGGMRLDEIAEALGVSRRTVEADWTHAKAWLRREFEDQAPA